MIHRILRFLGRVRRLLSLPHRPTPGQAAHPGPLRKRTMHLMAPGMKTACALPVSAENWVTIQGEYVNCRKCKVEGRRRTVRAKTRLR